MKRWWPWLLVLPTLAVSVAGWFLLPDELVVQIGLDGQPSNVLPKPAGLLIPLGLGALGAFWPALGSAAGVRGGFCWPPPLA